MLANSKATPEAKPVNGDAQPGCFGPGRDSAGVRSTPAHHLEIQDLSNRFPGVQRGVPGVPAEEFQTVLYQEHLTLQIVCLKPPEKWVAAANKLSFIFPSEGSGQYVSRSATHRLSPGDVLILNPTGDGAIGANPGSEFAFSFFVAKTEDVFPLFGNFEISQLQNVFEGLKAARMHGLATPLAKECHALLAETSPQLNLNHRVQMLRVVAALLGMEFGMVQPHLPGFVHAEDHLMHVLEGLTTDELMSLSVGELAVRFACSKRHLSRLFHQHFGFSVAAMKMEMRLLKAVAILRDPNSKIINVAENCGFNCLGLFNACFKRRFGVTPSQRRKMMTEAQGQPDRLLHHGSICPLRSKGMCPSAGYPGDLPPPKADTTETRKARSAKIVITVKTAGIDQPCKPVRRQQRMVAIPEPLASRRRRSARRAPSL